MVKQLFYASASILMLALAHHLRATTATAQALDGRKLKSARGDGSDGCTLRVDSETHRAINSLRRRIVHHHGRAGV